MQSVTAVKTLYTYDANGNMTRDDINRTSSIKYDHRNLMTEIRVIKSESSIIDPIPVDVLYLTYYRYDEAGNRVRKKRYKYNGSDPDPVFVTEGSNPSWALQSDEYYVRDISGKEIAIYSGSSLTQWNIWGLDNVGKINADTTRNYYLKDHLGSIRAVLNSTNTVVSAQDYDAWGYPLKNRTYNGIAMRYDFTGKERDNETSYDYFGARYYDSRIGRWGQVEPLLDKFLSFSPYNFTLSNPINYYDPNGLSTHTDKNGNVLAVYNDEDLNVYKHDVEQDFFVGPLKDGEVMGSTLYWDEFINPVSREIEGRIMFGEDWGSTIEELHNQAMNEPDIIMLALKSKRGEKYDLKSNPNYAPSGEFTGKTFKGKIISARSAGNYLAGYNAGERTNLSFDTYMKLAGALNTGNFDALTISKILFTDFSIEPAPYYGELEYSGRMIERGWFSEEP